MTDKELLELAAKAANVAGINGVYPIARDSSGEVYYWNPLTDDGDALRLAVKLRLEFEWWKNGVSVGRDDMPPSLIEHVVDDPAAATRRAIVRAAAEIGKTVKEEA